MNIEKVLYEYGKVVRALQIGAEPKATIFYTFESDGLHMKGSFTLNAGWNKEHYHDFLQHKTFETCGYVYKDGILCFEINRETNPKDHRTSLDCETNLEIRLAVSPERIQEIFERLCDMDDTGDLQLDNS
jgi:hypothetical protein